MTEQGKNSNNSCEETESLASKFESLKCSGEKALSAKDYEVAVEHF